MPQESKKVVGAFSKFPPVVNGGKGRSRSGFLLGMELFRCELLDFFFVGGIMEKYTVI